MPKSPQITRNCLDAVFVEFGGRRTKPASALNFVEFDGILPQLLEMVGIDSPSRHHFKALMLATRSGHVLDSRSQVPLSPFAGGQPPKIILSGVLMEKPVRRREKLSKAKPRDSKGVVCRGLPWSCFGQRFYLSRSRWITFPNFRAIPPEGRRR